MAIEDKDTATDLSVAPVVGPDDPRRFTDSGIEVKTLYTSEDLPPELDLGQPGEFPYTRGVHAEMYRKRRWTMRQYAGYASAKESNERYKYLLAHGSTGLSMAFDLPTQLGLDSDDPRSLGEVGRTGVAIDTIDDMRTAFDGIPLDEVSTSMTINAPAAVLLLLYELVAEEQGVEQPELRGTVQNDILKEYIARGNFIFPPEPSMRLTTDLFAYCKENIPKWNTCSISGYHFREKGASAVQEVAFTLACGMAYVQAALDAGLKVDDFAPRLAFFFNGHNNVFQEVAKFRAARNMWAHAMKERFGAQDPRSLMLRFHTQTGGVTLTAQQPLNNVVRVALQGFAAVCGGTQSLHTNGFDEALALPSERAAKLALRTQQVIAHESGATDTVDPFAGSYYVESLTAEIEKRAWALIEKIDEQGGSVEAIAFIKNEIEESAFGYHERYRLKQDVVVGVNEFVEDSAEVEEILSVDPESERAQLERLKTFKAERDHELTDKRLQELKDAAERHRQPAPADPPGAQGQGLGRRGVRRTARRVRRIPTRDVTGARSRGPLAGLPAVKRLLVALAFFLIASPAQADVTVSTSTTQAGAPANVTINATFASTPSSVKLSLPPGLVGNPNAEPQLLAGRVPWPRLLACITGRQRQRERAAAGPDLQPRARAGRARAARHRVPRAGQERGVDQPPPRRRTGLDDRAAADGRPAGELDARSRSTATS